MSAILQSTDEFAGIPPYPVRRWTVSEYRHLAEIGVLTEDDHVELLEGWIVPKMTKNPPHEWAVTEITGLLAPHLGEEWVLRVQCAINTGDSEPEPDHSIVNGPRDRYLTRHPSGDDVAQVIEIADSSLERDRRKAALYARAGIPRYWIVNLVDGQIEVHSDPEPVKSRYRTINVLGLDETVDLILGHQTVASLSVEQFLPPQN